jgi:hypothetical protein
LHNEVKDNQNSIKSNKGQADTPMEVFGFFSAIHTSEKKTKHLFWDQISFSFKINKSIFGRQL